MESPYTDIYIIHFTTNFQCMFVRMLQYFVESKRQLMLIVPINILRKESARSRFVFVSQGGGKIVQAGENFIIVKN